MTEAEARAASEELTAILQVTPSGSWQVRTLSKILLQLIATGPAIASAEPAKEKPARTTRAAHG